MAGMNSFADFFKTQVKNPLPVGMVMKYNTYRVDKTIKHFVFVEGSSDEVFYKNTTYKELADYSKYIFQNYEEKNGGKESVFYAYHQLKNDKNLQSDIDRCVFIVDRDWDNSLKSKNKWVVKKDENHITVTLGHSMECYFLENDNVKVIFQELGISNLLEDFNKTYIDFINKTSNYWALKAVMQYAFNSQSTCYYKKTYDFGDIFKYDFTKKEYIDMSKVDLEVRNMEKAISGNEDLKRYYSVWKKKILEQPRLIRGHNAFDFLYQYINTMSNLRIRTKDLFDLVNKMYVDITIRTPL